MRLFLCFCLWERRSAYYNDKRKPGSRCVWLPGFCLPANGAGYEKSGEILSGFFSLYVRDLAGLSSGIRTHGLYHPKVARYQSAPYPATARAIIAPVFRKCKGYFKFLSI